MRRARKTDQAAAHNTRVVYQVASWCLSYPDEQFAAALPMLGESVAALPTGAERDLLAGFLDDVAGFELADLQQRYVDVFDLSRKHALYLSYWTDGDTRRRGEVLLQFKNRYRASGFLVNTRGELTDYLPLVLEYAALADAADGYTLLQEYRPSLELLRLGLLEDRLSYADVVAAVCATLPGESPRDRAAVQAMANAGVPTEEVGLDSFDPRLLPLMTAGGQR